MIDHPIYHKLPWGLQVGIGNLILAVESGPDMFAISIPAVVLGPREIWRCLLSCSARIGASRERDFNPCISTNYIEFSLIPY